MNPITAFKKAQTITIMIKYVYLADGTKVSVSDNRGKGFTFGIVLKNYKISQIKLV